jgi:hypothetical protein
MDWATRVPGTIDALVQVFQTAPELDGVLIMDGPEIGPKAAARVLSVGWTAIEGETAVESQVTAEGLAGNPDREGFTVRCTAAVVGGATDVPAVRRAAYELLTAAGAVIARNRRLGGAMRVQMGRHSLMQGQTNKGAQALLVFDVDVDSFTRR